MPAWWLLLYPLTYYFIGAYLQEYGLKLRAWQTALALVACIAAFGAFNSIAAPRPIPGYAGNRLGRFSDSARKRFAVPSPSSDKNHAHPRFFQLLFTKISELSLGIYLVSIIFDNIFYPRLAAAVSSVPLRLNYYPVIVPLVFICSALFSQLLLWIQKPLPGPSAEFPGKSHSRLQIKGESDL